VPENSSTTGRFAVCTPKPPCQTKALPEPLPVYRRFAMGGFWGGEMGYLLPVWNWRSREALVRVGKVPNHTCRDCSLAIGKRMADVRAALQEGLLSSPSNRLMGQVLSPMSLPPDIELHLAHSRFVRLPNAPPFEPSLIAQALATAIEPSSGCLPVDRRFAMAGFGVDRMGVAPPMWVWRDRAALRQPGESSRLSCRGERP
jgi:hypothetical protein